ncbi:MAG: hypothetical protein ACREKB_06360, partial [Candidatus Rokuibacteriota bacterium]
MFLIRTCVALVVVVSVTAPLAAQPMLSSPYREELGSEIRGLTTKEIEDLREGRGMGLARAAELNGYPGPRHVLDAVQAGQFHLSPQQLAGVGQLFEGMSREARRLGAAILTEEQALEAGFRAGKIDAVDLRARLTRIAGLHGTLRAIHLKTHLETRALLTDHQIERYNQIRGYRPGGAGSGQHK